jgi:anti-sigma regulatory factor (Ser/Thr protein kinase)
LPAQPGELRLLRHRLDDWLRIREVGQEDRDAVVLAVNEATANAIEHGAQGHGRVELAAYVDGDRLEITIADRGTWTGRPGAANRGRGLLLMRALMDEVEIQPGSGGTRVVLRRRIGSKEPR